MLSYFIEHNRYLNIVGIFVVLFIAFLFSKKRHAINYKLIVNALLMQLGIAFVVLKTSFGQAVVQTIADGIKAIYNYADAGSQFVFGSLANPAAGAWGMVFAFKVLPIIVFFGALMSLLFHIGIVQRVVVVISYLIRPIFGTSGAETLCAIANSFLGQTEAPLLVRNYLADMTKSELLVVMVSGMGTISGAILAAFAMMGVPAEHLLTASVMSIPGTILIAKLLYPETEKTKTGAGIGAMPDSPASNVLEAISSGTSDGLNLALNVGAMLIAFLALLAMTDGILSGASYCLNVLFSYVHIPITVPALTLKSIFAVVFAPFGYLLGFTGEHAFAAASLLGVKVSVNEFIAYSEMVAMNLPERMTTILTYALCGFANFSCIGIQIGGIGALVPGKRKWLAELGLYAVLGGSLANLLSALIAGLML